MARVPKLCHHKGTGRGYSTDPATGLEVYHGMYGTVECQQAYDRWLMQLLARRADVASGTPAGADVTVARLITDYLAWAAGYYVKHGKPTTERGTVKQVASVVL